MSFNIKRAQGMLGIARRAGLCVSGMDACLEKISFGDAHVVLLDLESSENTAVKIKRACEDKDVPFRYIEGVGQAIGKPGRKLCAILDAGIAHKIKLLLDETNELQPGGVVKK